MQLQNKERIAYLAAITLLLSYAELFLPRIVPFFRLGLSNIAILLSLSLNFWGFFILTIIKSIANSLISGTLFSPFMLISLAQSVASGLCMWIVFRFAEKHISVYGLSILGSTISAIIQIYLSSLYLGTGTLNLLGPMIVFGIFSGILTAFLSQALHIPQESPILMRSYLSKNYNYKTSYVKVLMILASVALIFVMDSLLFLLIALLSTLTLQLLCKRKILVLPHISLWLFVIISSIFISSGKILFSIGPFNITQGALLTGIKKAIKLSCAAALSQCAANIHFSKTGIIALTLGYFSGINNVFRTHEGNVIQKVKASLSATELKESATINKAKNNDLLLFVIVFIILLTLIITQYFFGRNFL